ncbi:MAG: hypothetical protein U1F46_09870 [Marinagarivorans sp.]
MAKSLQHKTIALLFHAQDAPGSIHNYLITYYAQLWQQQGAKVIVLFGCSRFVAADLIVVHVDLSVVPEEYLVFAARYPVVLNGRVRDIRKSQFSQQLVQKDDEYTGPVIVKSDCNYAAMPELRIVPAQINTAQRLFASPLDYHIYPNKTAVPDDLWRQPGLVIEQFLPEVENGLYHIRFYNFLGAKGNCMRVASVHPVVHISQAVRIEQIPLDPRLDALRRELNFDYGKFDYVQREGEIVLFDTNKTTGFVGGSTDPQWQQARFERAMGIVDYLK